MNYNRACSSFLDENFEHFVIEYRGTFKEQIDKLDYACGDTITDTLGVIAVRENQLNKLRIDVPAIIFIETRSIYVLQDIDPSDADNIKPIKDNPYLNLTGKGVLVGLIDTGISYLNEEFMREDGTTRVISIWDQTVQEKNKDSLYIGSEYTSEEINKAINAYKSDGDPYTIVPSKDEIDHGTKMAGIIGARGNNGQMQGVANDCDFVVVKLLQAPYYSKVLRENNHPAVPVYNNTELLAAIEYLRKVSEKLDRPMIIYIGVGSNDGSHDGYNITGRFMTSIASKSGIAFVSGTGNTGDSEGHASSFIRNVGEVSTVELRVTKEMKILSFYIWVQRPDRMALNIIDPTGVEFGFISPKIYSVETRDFILVDTRIEVQSYDPESFTGHQAFSIKFSSIKEGIWKFQLRGEYITNGRYDIWLPDKTLLPEGTKFLTPDPYTTLTVPSTARKVISVAYYNSINNSTVTSSGKGFNTNYLVNPDIAAPGINILTISGTANNVVTVSGSSAATAIVVGVCCLLTQWGVIDKNYTGLYSTKLRSILVYGAQREREDTYPNENIGYGKLDLLNVFNVLGGSYRNNDECTVEYKEYHINNLFIRCPIDEFNVEGGIINGK